MGTHTPKAAENNAQSFSSDHSYPILPTDSTSANTNGDGPISGWHRPLLCTDGGEEKQCGQSGLRSHVSLEVSATGQLPFSISSDHSNLSEHLNNFLIIVIAEEEGELRAKELADAFSEAPLLPPVTKHSLGELDIQNIITNIKLRHDVNFDRELSFRPNSNRVKGHGKKSLADKYWAALVAELRLYDCLSQESLPQELTKDWKATTQYVEKRLPTMFQTIREVLKSLVPDRDHSRIDANLDVSMLMQGIERGVCDLVRLGEWIARLVKEHCAPMRDAMVDSMVGYIKKGVAQKNLNRSELIVCGLRELLGILEAMKLVSQYLNDWEI